MTDHDPASTTFPARTSGTTPSPAPARRSAAPRHRLQDRHQDRRGDPHTHDADALLAWVAGCFATGGADLDGHLAPDPAFTVWLQQLTGHPRPLPERVAQRFEAAPTTVGELATALLAAVTDVSGPRCRSYRAAVYYLQGDPGPLFEE